MDSNSLAFAKYWRNSLADAEFEQGAFSRSEAEKFTTWPKTAIESGRLDQSEIDKFFSNEPENVDYVEVVLRPRVYLRSVEHNKEHNAGSPNVVTPLITVAKLSRSGYLFPTPATFIPRDLLEPLPKGVFAIGEINSLDRYKTLCTSGSIKADEIETGDEENAKKNQAAFLRQWQEYLAGNQKLLDAVAGEWIIHPKPYLKASQWLHPEKRSAQRD